MAMTRYLIIAKDAEGRSLSLGDPDRLNDAESFVIIDGAAAMLAYVAEPRTAYWYDGDSDDGWVAAQVAVYEARPGVPSGPFAGQFSAAPELHYV